jgi:hypothetical protein
METNEVRELSAEELSMVSGGVIDNPLKGLKFGINDQIDAFLNGYYSTCGCNSGHSANWSQP